MLNVALSANERYMPGAIVAAAGVAVNARAETELTFHLFVEGVKDETFAFFEKTLKRIHERTAVVRHECDERILSGLPSWAGSRLAAVRCHYATLMPEVDCCLYLDCDVLYLASVEEHFSYADDAVYACVVREEYEQTRRNERDWIRSNAGVEISDDRYFNSGVVLFNFKKMREDRIPERLMGFFREHTTIPSPDQDALNATFGGCVRMLPPKFNRLQILLTDDKLAERPAIHYVSGNPWLPKLSAVANRRFRLWHRFADEYVWQRRGESCRRCFTRRVLILKRLLYYGLRCPGGGRVLAEMLQLFGLVANGVAWRNQQVLGDVRHLESQ